MSELAQVELRDGRLHIPAAVYEALFRGCPAVALLAREGQWWILPLLSGAGGLQVKLRHPRGDRVVEAQEFFRSQGCEDRRDGLGFTLGFDLAKGAFRMQAVGG